MLSTDVGQSAHLRTVSSDRLHQILKDLRIPVNADFDPDALRHLAEFSNADMLVSGHYAKFGEQIRIDATLQDLRDPIRLRTAERVVQFPYLVTVRFPAIYGSMWLIWHP